MKKLYTSSIHLPFKNSLKSHPVCLFKKKKKQPKTDHFCVPVHPERGLGGAAAEEGSPSLRPVYSQQGRRQQLRRGVHHGASGADAAPRGALALPQRPGELQRLRLRLGPLLIYRNRGPLRKECWVFLKASSKIQPPARRYELSSAINYTVNERRD